MAPLDEPFPLDDEEAIEMQHIALMQSKDHGASKDVRKGVTNMVLPFLHPRFLSGNVKVALRFPRSLIETASTSSPAPMADVDKAFEGEVEVMKRMSGFQFSPKLLAYSTKYRLTVMEYFDGGTLADRIRHSDGWTYWQRISVIHQLFEGLHEFWSHLGNNKVLVHRDIKVINAIKGRAW